jgi:hypothetical protein
MTAGHRRPGNNNGPSIFVGQHDRDHADGDGRIGGQIFQVAIEIIDLEKDRVAFGFERAKVGCWRDGVAAAGAGAAAQKRLARSD